MSNPVLNSENKPKLSVRLTWLIETSREEWDKETDPKERAVIFGRIQAYVHAQYMAEMEEQ